MTARLDDGTTPQKTQSSSSSTRTSSPAPSQPTTFTLPPGAVDPRLIYAYLVQQHGVSPATAAGILANIQYESSFRPGVLGDNGSSGGLFQHHASRWSRLKNYAAQRGVDWTDWRVQVDFAMVEAKERGINLQNPDPVAAAREWTLRFEQPANAEAKAATRSTAVWGYMYGDPANLNLGPQASQMTSNQPVNLPAGGSWFKVGGEYYVAYRFYGNNEKTGPSAVVYYRATVPPPAGTQIHSESTWRKYSASWVDGGTTDVFRGSNYKTYQEMVENLLRQWGLWGSDALTDQGVLDIVAIGLTREMSEAELANRLRQTAWYQSRTDKEREWNDLSEAERQARIVEEAMKMSQLWWTYVGRDLQVGSYDTNGDGLVSADELRKSNKDLYTWAERIASGKASQVEAVNAWMKEVALQDPESPWSRMVRSEEQARGEFATNVANMAGEIRDLYWEWGLPVSEETLRKQAEDVVMNRLAIEDLEQSLREQAQGLYPNKPQNLTTRQWAQPYMQLYMNTLETPEPGLDDPLLQRGLSEGMTLADFRKMLRMDERWLGTVNARNEMNEKIAELGRVMGF
ncbi:MAG TPA: phage tail tip lysozyme [Acidimicrobiia bacterium]